MPLHRLPLGAVALLLGLALSPARAPAQAPAPVDTTALRKEIQSFLATPPLRQAEDILFVSGAYDQMVVGREALAAASAEVRARRPRTNVTTKRDVVRIEVARSGDMAYVVSNGLVSWDGPPGKRVGLKNSQVTVLRKTAQGWEVAASLTHPFSDPAPVP